MGTYIPAEDLHATIDGGVIVLDAKPYHTSRIRSITGAKFDKLRDKWTLPLSWTSCVALYLVFQAAFRPSAELNDWGVEERARRVGPAEELRGRLDFDGLDSYKQDQSTKIVKTAIEVAAAMKDAHGIELKPYQVVGAAFLAVTGHGMLLDQLGVGKTVQAITALQVLQAYGVNPYPVLVVAPASVKQVWLSEFQKWNPALTVVGVSGTIAERRAALATPAHIYVMSYSALVSHSSLTHYSGAVGRKKCLDCGGMDPKITEAKCQVHAKELNKMTIRTVVADEAHRLINPENQWTQALWTVSDQAQFRFALTGTPVQDTVEDFWALLRFIAPKEFKAKTPFLERYAALGYSPWGVREVIGMNPDHEQEFAAITQPYWRRVLKSAVLADLPPVYTEHRVIPMHASQRKAYRDMAKNMIAGLESGGAVIALSPLVRQTRLAQFASSYAEIVIDPLTGEETVKLHEPSNKINAFLDDIREYDSESKGVVVFAHSRQLIDLLSAKMKLHSIDHEKFTGATSEDDRTEIVRKFQAGEVKYLLMTIDSGGAGLTLTAADTMVFLQRSPSSVAMTQALGRAHRIGSEIHDQVRVIHYISEKTVEWKQLRALDEKAGRVEEVFKDNAQLALWLKEDLS